MRSWLVVPRRLSLDIVRTSDLSVRATIDVPPGAAHALAEDGSELAWADGAVVTVVGGLREGAPRVECTFEACAKVDALALREDVVFFAGFGTDDSSRQASLPPEMRGPPNPAFMEDGEATRLRPVLGLIDRNAEVFRAMALPEALTSGGKRITRMAFRGDALLVVDERVAPSVLIYDVSALREPRLVDSGFIPSRRNGGTPRGSRITGVADDGVTLAIVEEHGDGRHVALVRLHDFRFYGGVMVAPAPPREARRPKVSGTYAVPLLAGGVDVAGSTLFLAAHDAGLLVVDLSAIMERRMYTFQGKVVEDWSARDVAPEAVRKLPVGAGTVVDVVAVDETRAYAIIDRDDGYHSELVEVTR